MKIKIIHALLLVLILPLTGCISIVGSLISPPLKVELTHTPLIDMKKIADELNPQTISVGEVIDARKKKTIGSYQGPMSQGIVTKVELANDPSIVLREAVIDGINKSGFLTPDGTQSAPDAQMNISGRIDSIKVFTQSRGFLKSDDTYAQVLIDFEIMGKSNNKVNFDILGEFIVEKTGNQIYGAQSGEYVDKAINDAVRKLLTNEKFLGFLIK